MADGLFPFQEECVEYALTHRYTLNGCEMGLGKTRIALVAAKRAGKKLAVFGPPFLRASWALESETIGIPHTYFPYTQLGSVRPEHLKDYGFWVAEECHYLKNPKAQRTNQFHTLLEACLPDYFLGVSGTPIKNRVPDIWTLLAFCSLGQISSNGPHLSGRLKGYYAFAEHFCQTNTLKVRGRKVRKYGALLDARLPELKALLANKYIRFRVKDVLPSLPELTRKEVPLPLLADAPGLKEAFYAYLEGSKIDPASKALSARLKAPHTAEYVESLYEGGGGPILVFTDHIAAAERLHELLGGSVMITGATPSSVRGEMVAEFQARGVPYLVATIGALSVGVTLHASRHVVFNDLSWTPSDNAQAEKRVHRIGQKNAVVAHYIVSSPTDAYIQKTLREKMASVDKII